jgi:hypothetical protein
MDPSELLRAAVDPTAPLPAGWPSGAAGAFLVFLFPVGAGIPLGVLMGARAGVPAVVIALLYFVSDLVLALTAEPMLAGVRWLGRRIPLLGALGDRLTRFTNVVGLQQDGVHGPLGLILVSFTISPTTGRAAAAAAGHGFFSGWTLAIIGDMAYFLLLMVSTLWLSSVIGDDRITIGIALVATWLLPLPIRRLQRRRLRARSSSMPTSALTPAHASAPIAPASAPPSPSRHSSRVAGANGKPGRRRARRGGR